MELLKRKVDSYLARWFEGKNQIPCSYWQTTEIISVLHYVRSGNGIKSVFRKAKQQGYKGLVHDFE